MKKNYTDKRYIFDLDGTLLTGDWSLTDQYFYDLFGDRAHVFIDNMKPLLDRYEREFPRYNYTDLSEYLKRKTGLDIQPKHIAEWDALSADITNVPEEGAIDLLDYLRRQGASIALLTNWFQESQEKRLAKERMLEYFNVVYGGDTITKPHKEAYLMAAAGHDPEKCIFIGDTVDNDYVGPKACGMQAILYDKKGEHHKTLVKVRSLSEIKDK